MVNWLNCYQNRSFELLIRIEQLNWLNQSFELITRVIDLP